MSEIVKDIGDVNVFVDDLIIFTKSEDEHYKVKKKFYIDS